MKKRQLWVGIVIGGVSLIVIYTGLYVLHRVFGNDVSPPLNCFISDKRSSTLIATPSQNIGLNSHIEEIQTIRLSSKPILYLAYNHDGSQLAAATNERVWILNSNYVEPIELTDNQGKLIRGLAFNPINNQLAVFGGHITIWDTQNYHIVKQFDEGAVTSIVFTDDGTQLIFSTTITKDISSERQLQTWNTKNYSKDASIKYPHLVEHFVMTPFGNCAVVKQRMAKVTGGYNMAVLDLSTGGWKLFQDQHDDIYHVAVSPDGETTASFSSTGLSLWNTRSEERLAASIDSNSYRGEFYKQGRYLIVLDALRNTSPFKESIRIIEVASGQEVAEITRNQADLTNIIIHPNEKSFTTSTNDGQIIIWNIRQQ